MSRSNQIKKSVVAAHNERAAGDAPSMGRVARMPGTGLPKGEKRKRKLVDRPLRKGRRKGGRVLLNWVILSGILGALGLGWMLYSLIARGGAMAPVVASERRLEIDSDELPVETDTELVSPSEAEALALVKAALAVREPSKATEHFRLGGQSAETVVNFLENLNETSGKVTSLLWESNMDVNGLSLEGVKVNFLKNDAPGVRNAFLVPDEQKNWKVDFEAFARTGFADWKALMENEVESAEMRVFITKDSYFNGVFSDDKEWTCYSIGSPDIQEIVQGYCRRASPQARAMDAIMAKGLRVCRVLLALQRVKGSRASQFEITRIVAEDWVRGAKPFDEGFHE